MGQKVKFSTKKSILAVLKFSLDPLQGHSKSNFEISLIAPSVFKVTLSIVNSEEFVFKANQKQSVQIDIGPEASR